MSKNSSSKIANPGVAASQSRSKVKLKGPASSLVISKYLDGLLNHAAIGDFSNAINGLQLENSGRATRIGAAVDACEATLNMARERGIDLLLVHHGIFWSPIQPVTGASYRKLKLALDADLALYSSHLPLDLHPEYGNNVRLARALGLKKTKPFFPEKGNLIGLRAEASVDRQALSERLSLAVGGPVKLIPGGPDRARKIGIVTGGAGSSIFQAAGEGIDTFITGEGPHWSYTAAEELGINVLYAGHYATETFGVRALAEHISEKYGLPWEFLDHPTGL